MILYGIVSGSYSSFSLLLYHLISLFSFSLLLNKQIWYHFPLPLFYDLGWGTKVSKYWINWHFSDFMSNREEVNHRKSVYQHSKDKNLEEISNGHWVGDWLHLIAECWFWNSSHLHWQAKYTCLLELPIVGFAADILTLVI